MYRNVRYLSEQKELEYIKRKELAARKEVVFRITHIENSPSKGDQRIWINTNDYK